MEKRILQICSYYSDSKLYQNLFDNLENLGIESSIYYFTDKNQNISNIPDHVIKSRCYNSFDRLLFFRKHKLVLKDLMDRIKLDDYSMLHCHSMMSNGYIGYKLHQKYGIEYITAVRKTDIFTFPKFKPYLIPLGRKILENARAVIFLSEEFRDKALEVFISKKDRDRIRSKSFIIPNGIDDIFHENPGEPKALEKEIKLIYVGKVDDPNKNVKTILKVGEMLKQQGEKVSITLVGRLETKRYMETVENSAARHIPQVDPQGVIANLRENNIFIMPSFTETFGLVYVEAMSQGLPVIYTKGQGFDGQFPEGFVGYHVNPSNVEEIVQIIHRIRENYGTISKNAIVASKKFVWKEIAKKYLKLYG